MENRIPRWLELVVLALAGVIGIGLFALAEWKIVGNWGFPLDDTWIHLQFARNLSAGQGFSFNPGDSSPGSTAPLWTLLLSLVFLFPWSPILSVKLLGSFLLLVNGWLTRCLARSAGLASDWALLAGLTVVLTPRLLWGSLSGMEVMLYAALATAGVWLHLRSWHRTPSFASTFLLALAALARPECLLLFPLTAVDRWRREANLSRLWSLYWRHLLLYAVVLAPAVCFNLYTTGRPLPNTFYAKVGGYGLLGAIADFDLFRMGTAFLLYPLQQAQELAQFAVENSLFLACLAPLGMLALVRPETLREGRSSWFILLVLVVFPLARGMLAPFKGATFQHGRYAAHLIPLLTVVGLMGLRFAWELLRQGGEGAWIGFVRKWGKPLCWGLILLQLLVADIKFARTYGRNVADIDRMHVSMGRWLAQHTPQDAVIATNDIGAIGYFSDRRLLDIVGLVTPEVLAYLPPGVPADRGVLSYLEEKKPGYLVILPNWYPELSARSDLFHRIHQVVLTGSTIAGGNRLVAYRTIWAED
jgi:arabinofuranosyltransferase